jgi:hypothetical protein
MKRTLWVVECRTERYPEWTPMLWESARTRAASLDRRDELRRRSPGTMAFRVVCYVPREVEP